MIGRLTKGITRVTIWVIGVIRRLLSPPDHPSKGSGLSLQGCLWALVLSEGGKGGGS